MRRFNTETDAIKNEMSEIFNSVCCDNRFCRACVCAVKEWHVAGSGSTCVASSCCCGVEDVDVVVVIEHDEVWCSTSACGDLCSPVLFNILFVEDDRVKGRVCMPNVDGTACVVVVVVRVVGCVFVVSRFRFRKMFAIARRFAS
jgi:hypothetical protein